jgi:hypothetical protein
MRVARSSDESNAIGTEVSVTVLVIRGLVGVQRSAAADYSVPHRQKQGTSRRFSPLAAPSS